MSKKLILLAFALTLGLISSAPAATIIWVSGNHDYNVDGVVDDFMWVDLLVAKSYTVDYRPGNWTTLNDDKIAALNAADLVIISRCTSSGDYATDAAELNQWDSITTPMLSMSTHLTRSNRWKWLNTTGTPAATPIMQVVDASHPIFTGVAIDADGMVVMIEGPNSSFPETPDAGNGTVLAKRADTGDIWIATWETGVEYYAGAGQIAGGPRMFMVAGTVEAAGGPNWGEMNLAPDGVKVFLNAVHYMLGGGRTTASNPEPADGAVVEDTWVSLNWTPGDFAVSHDIYLGDNLNDVQAATRDSELFRSNQTETFYVAGFPGYAYPDGLVPGTTYYWRIDEVNEADPNSPWKGDVWSFSIPSRKAHNPVPADGAELVALNTKLTWTAGFGAKIHTVYFGDNFDMVSNATGGLPQGTTTYTPSALQEEKVYYWRVDEFDGSATYKGHVWGFTTPGAAGNPQPAKGATGVQMTAKLSWTPATNATSHQVYFGTDEDAVRNATTASPEYKGSKAPGNETLDPGRLAWHTTYYWRTDAVYNTGTVKGLVWSFTTADFLLVDDFESYNDIDPPDPASNRIFDKWIDGFATPATNGALVGNDLPPYAEQTIVHGGLQSMPYRYDNANKTSEATMTLVYPRDWTEEGVGRLSLWFRGDRANAAERMYVALNANAVVYHDNANAAQTAKWTEWIIDLQAFTDQGVNLTNVDTLTIGFGTKNSPAPGGSGKMYIDDIRLNRPSTAP